MECFKLTFENVVIDIVKCFMKVGLNYIDL